MRTLLTILMTTMMLLLTACGGGNAQTGADTSAQKETQTTASARSDQRVLVAYFSATGTTKRAAKGLAEALGADTFEIVPQTPYTSTDLNWSDSTSRSTSEMNDEASRPPISGTVDDMDSYDAVFVGFPIWWYTEPRIIDTFLESYAFSGNTTVPVATGGGSGLGKAPERMQRIATGSTVAAGRLLNGHQNPNELRDWAQRLGLMR